MSSNVNTSAFTFGIPTVCTVPILSMIQISPAFLSILFRSIPLTTGICMQLLCNFYISLAKSSDLFILFCGPQKTTKRQILSGKFSSGFQFSVCGWNDSFLFLGRLIRFFCRSGDSGFFIFLVVWSVSFRGLGVIHFFSSVGWSVSFLGWDDSLLFIDRVMRFRLWVVWSVSFRC